MSDTETSIVLPEDSRRLTDPKFQAAQRAMTPEQNQTGPTKPKDIAEREQSSQFEEVQRELIKNVVKTVEDGKICFYFDEDLYKERHRMVDEAQETDALKYAQRAFEEAVIYSNGNREALEAILRAKADESEKSARRETDYGQKPELHNLVKTALEVTADKAKVESLNIRISQGEDVEDDRNYWWELVVKAEFWTPDVSVFDREGKGDSGYMGFTPTESGINVFTVKDQAQDQDQGPHHQPLHARPVNRPGTRGSSSNRGGTGGGDGGPRRPENQAGPEDLGNLPFNELQARIKNQISRPHSERNQALLDDLLDERSLRVELFADGGGVGVITRRVSRTLRDSDNTNVVTNIKRLASELEEEMQLAGGYRDIDQTLVQELVLGVARTGLYGRRLYEIQQQGNLRAYLDDNDSLQQRYELEVFAPIATKDAIKEAFSRAKQPAADNMDEMLRQYMAAAQRQFADAIADFNRVAQEMRGEGSRLNLPPDPERQREIVREILEEIEDTNQDCYSWANVRKVQQLEISYKSMNPEVAAEAKTRIALHDSSQLIRSAGGYIDRKDGMTIGVAATEALRREHDLSREVMETLGIGEGQYSRMPGLDVPHAWDLIQEVNFNYPQFVHTVNLRQLQDYAREHGWSENQTLRAAYLLDTARFDYERAYDKKEQKEAQKEERDRKLGLPVIERRRLSRDEKQELRRIFTKNEMKTLFFSTAGTEFVDADPVLGEVPTNFFVDSNISRKKAVRDLLVERMGIPEKDARKSLQLAEKLGEAGLENAIFNRTVFTGNDQLAECIGLQDWRMKRRIRGRQTGPLINQNQIPGFGNSWIRSILTKEAGERVREDTDQKREDFAERSAPGAEMPIFSQDIDLDEVTAGSWQFHCSVVASRYFSLKELMMRRDVKPGDITQDLLRQSVPYFTQADKPKDEINPETGEPFKNGPLFLRFWFIAGIVDLAVSDPNLGWKPADIRELYVTCVGDPLAPETGAFLTQGQWDEIMKITSERSKMANQEVGEAIRAAAAKFLGGDGGGGSRPRGKRR